MAAGPPRERTMDVFRIDRRRALAGIAAAGAVGMLGGCGAAAAPDTFVRREGKGFTRGGKPYRYAGANAWYLAWLGAGAPIGDRTRLTRELETLKGLGVTNIRLLAGAEEGPLRNSVRPGFIDQQGKYNLDLLEGLDFALAEMAKRNMTAVLYVSNFWEWSGGFMTRLYWATGKYLNMNDPAHPWPAFPDMASEFYANPQATRGYFDYLATLIGRTNGFNNRRYADDPTIMAWQLGNEPRPGVTPAVIDAHLPAFYKWIGDSAALIRKLAPNQLVSLGMEGTIATNGREDIVLRAHQDIDYLTAHIWPLNWGWVDGKDLAGTWDAGKAKVDDYLSTHIRLAEKAGKPLVFEEFGFPRDGELYAPSVPTTFRERYYKLIYAAAQAHSSGAGGSVSGTNFWGWTGEARAQHGDHHFQPGDTQYMGDPPHEPQGWYGNFDSDENIMAVIREHSASFATV